MFAFNRYAIPLAEFVVDIERSRLETGITGLPRSNGTRRTLHKLLLSAVLYELGAKCDNLL